MKRGFSIVRRTAFLALLAVPGVLTAASSSGCGYNSMQSQDEAIKSAWANVVNEYKRRNDLLPNLMKTVEGYASHEKEIMTVVATARSQLASVKATPELINDDEAFKKFTAAQTQLSGSLGRLFAIAESYPQLKADQSFRDFQAQLEGSENRITVARGRYISAVQAYNTTIRSFPSNLTAKMFGYQTKPTFTVEDEKAISSPPAVNFSK